MTLIVGSPSQTTAQHVVNILLRIILRHFQGLIGNPQTTQGLKLRFYTLGCCLAPLQGWVHLAEWLHASKNEVEEMNLSTSNGAVLPSSDGSATPSRRDTAAQVRSDSDEPWVNISCSNGAL